MWSHVECHSLSCRDSIKRSFFRYHRVERYVAGVQLRWICFWH